MLQSSVTLVFLSTPRAIAGEQRKPQKRKSLWEKEETPGGPPVKGVSKGQRDVQGVSKPAAGAQRRVRRRYFPSPRRPVMWG